MSEIEGAASAAPSTPEEAQALLNAATTPEQAWAIYELAAEREESWRVVKLRAERRYGQLIGPVEEQGHTGRGHSVTTGHAIPDTERKARRQARKIAAVPQEKFDAYVKKHGPKSTREGLLREVKNPPREHRTRVNTGSEVTKSAEVLNWIRKRDRQGMSEDELCVASETANDWPLPGKPLTPGPLRSCRAAIWHLEDQGVRWPIKTGALALKHTPNPLKKRLRELDATDRRGKLWSMSYEVTRLCLALETLHITDVVPSEPDYEVLAGLHEDLLRTQDWLERELLAIQGHLGEHGIYQTLAKLRVRTIANGCTPAEAEQALRMITHLEHTLGARLTG